jgi:hypothetical protein
MMQRSARAPDRPGDLVGPVGATRDVGGVGQRELQELGDGQAVRHVAGHVAVRVGPRVDQRDLGVLRPDDTKGTGAAVPLAHLQHVAVLVDEGEDLLGGELANAFRVAVHAADQLGGHDAEEAMARTGQPAGVLVGRLRILLGTLVGAAAVNSGLAGTTAGEGGGC